MVVEHRKASQAGVPGEEMQLLRNNVSLKDWIHGTGAGNSEDKVSLNNVDDKSDSVSGGPGSISFDSKSTPRRAHITWDKHTKPLAVLPFAAIIFYGVCGGPFGIEDSINYGGPFFCIIGLVTFPFVWCLPEALVSTELSTMFPENSGYVIWVATAFGPFWGFMEGFTSWVSGVLDNSIYPLYLAKYAGYFLPYLRKSIPQKVFFLLVSFLMTYWNYLGLVVTGYTAVVLTAIVLFPFILMFFISIPKLNPSNWMLYNASDFSGNFLNYLNVMFWNFSYWDSSSSLSGEVANPHKTIPKAYGLALALVAVTYLIPVLTATGVLGAAEAVDGYFSEAGTQVGGSLVAILIMVSAVASQIGLFEAEMSSDSFLIDGLSERGFLPRFMGTRSRHGTPTVGLLMSCAGIIFMVLSFTFEEVVDMLNSAYCLSMLLEFSAFIFLRIKAPHAERPYRVPLSTMWMCLLLLPASILILVLLMGPLIQLNTMMIVFNGCLIATAVASYHLLNWCRKKYPNAFNALEVPTIADLKGVNRTEEDAVESSHLLDDN